MKSARTKGEVPGPTIAVGGYAASALPPNPSDTIIGGGPLPLMLAQETTMRRPFKEVTHTPLHYNDGPGPDEQVTSRRTFPALVLGPEHRDNPPVGNDPNRYSAGENSATTLRGVEIRGT